MNRIGNPDWVKIFGDFNGQIKLRAKQKIQVSFCYTTIAGKSLQTGQATHSKSGLITIIKKYKI